MTEVKKSPQLNISPRPRPCRPHPPPPVSVLETLMEFISLALLAVTLTLLFIHRWLFRISAQFPPCPSRPLPIFGHLFSLSSDLRPLFRKWREQCGDNYSSINRVRDRGLDKYQIGGSGSSYEILYKLHSLYLGPKMMVVLNGYDLIKETLMKRGEDFSDRPHTFVDTVTKHPQIGIVSSSGKNWKEQQTASLQILRTFGFGKNILAEKIQEEVYRYVKHLSGYNGKPTDIRAITCNSTSNVICSILFGQRFEYSDMSFRKLTSYMNELMKDFTTAGVQNFLPMLRYLPGDLFRLKRAENNMKELFQLFEVFIGKIRKGNLNVQKQIFYEIVEHIGTDRPPTMQDRSKMTYLNATILETQRLASIVPIAFPHTCPRDVTVRGYTIPKGSFIMPNLDSVLHYEKIWEHDVMSFRPERFIDQDGQLKNYNELIPFSVGRRACLGESMTKTELFLYLANMIQKFEFLPVDPDHPPPRKYVFGLTVSPEPYECRIVERSH
ncbi:cytochrome P450 2 sub U member 1 [Bulinus truncatus]|nr:cytochrome P450 2 sub U member 1 [Bulinus truncatus]